MITSVSSPSVLPRSSSGYHKPRLYLNLFNNYMKKWLRLFFVVISVGSALVSPTISKQQSRKSLEVYLPNCILMLIFMFPSSDVLLLDNVSFVCVFWGWMRGMCHTLSLISNIPLCFIVSWINLVAHTVTVLMVRKSLVWIWGRIRAFVELLSLPILTLSVWVFLPQSHLTLTPHHHHNFFKFAYKTWQDDKINTKKI